MHVNGSGISIGHPVGATGGRIMATLLHEMERRQVRHERNMATASTSGWPREENRDG